MVGSIVTTHPNTNSSLDKKSLIFKIYSGLGCGDDWIHRHYVLFVMKKQHPRAKKIWAGFFYVITGIAVFFVALVGFSARWAFTNWGDLDIDEIIFQLKTPLEGTGNGMIGNFILTALLPALAVFAVFLVLMIIFKQSKQRLICAISFIAASALVFVMIQPIIWKRLDVQNWIE